MPGSTRSSAAGELDPHAAVIPFKFGQPQSCFHELVAAERPVRAVHAVFKGGIEAPEAKHRLGSLTKAGCKECHQDMKL